METEQAGLTLKQARDIIEDQEASKLIEEHSLVIDVGDDRHPTQIIAGIIILACNESDATAVTQTPQRIDRANSQGVRVPWFA